MKTKKYIPVEKTWENRCLDCFGTKCDTDDAVELPDLASMSDLEKMKWVLKEIGVGYSFYENIPNDGNKSIELWTYAWYEDTKLIRFDANGKLIK